MISKEIVVRCESGLHNKQATFFVQKANEFDCSIWVESGTTVMLTADGNGAEAAVEALEGLLLRDVY